MKNYYLHSATQHLVVTYGNLILAALAPRFWIQLTFLFLALLNCIYYLRAYRKYHHCVEEEGAEEAELKDLLLKILQK